MTDHDPLSAIEVLLGRPLGRATYGGRHVVLADELRTALTEARQAVGALVADNRALVRDRNHEMRAREAERQRANDNYDRLVEVAKERNALREALAAVPCEHQRDGYLAMQAERDAAREALDALVAERGRARDRLLDSEWLAGYRAGFNDSERGERCGRYLAALPQPATDEAHHMVPGSHERPEGAECRCRAPWNHWEGRCARSDQPGTDKHECDTGHFDRTICPEPCGMMHSFCATCGKRADTCAHEPATDEEASQ